MFKKICKYFFFFFFFLIVLIIFGNNGNDTIWNYGFSHAIVMGEIPYRDFNIISTPLYSFIMSLGLLIKDTYFVFIIEQAFLCTILLYIVEKLVEKKYLLFLIAFCFPIFNLLFPNYNFMVLLILVLLLYLEKINKSDRLIGIILGLLILSKHTIGTFILLLSMISTLDIKKGFKRLVFSFIPILFFVIYLIITKSFYSFIDLSILGLFDFGKNNSSISIFSAAVAILILLYSLYSIFRNKKNVYNYYLLGSMIFVVPICDLFHVFYLICFFIIILFLNNYINLSNKRIYITSFIFIILLLILNVSFEFDYLKNIKDNHLGRMKAYLLEYNRISYVDNILNKYQEYDNSYMISISSMYFDLESNKKISYFDVPLHGNFGYNGIEKMKKRIDTCHNCYFFINDSENSQFAVELINYLRAHYEQVDSIEDFEIYKVG